MDELTRKLLDAAPQHERCRFLKSDETGPYCDAPHFEGKSPEDKRAACDNASLQLYCLDCERMLNCMYRPDYEDCGNV